MPKLLTINPQVQLIVNLQRCLNQAEGATKRYLANLAGAAGCAFGHWVSDSCKPRLDQLCRLCYALRIPLFMLFTEVPQEWRGPERRRMQRNGRRGNRSNSLTEPAIPRNDLRSILAVYLHENPPPSVAEIARRLGFRCSQTLRQREPELCKKIVARRRDSGKAVSVARPLFMSSEGNRLEDILRAHLAKECQQSLSEIASSLGYKNSGPIRRYPELCQAITLKHRQQSLLKREELQRALEDAQRESPPPALMQIARRLGFNSKRPLSRAYPELCTSHRQWRRAWFEQQRNELRLSIREWVAGQRAPTVISVCRHFGISTCYFRSRFPEERAEVLRRAADCARVEREHRAALIRSEAFKIVQKLQEERVFPSLSRVKSMLSQDLARPTAQVRAALKEAIPYFGPIMSHRNELGQFA